MEEPTDDRQRFCLPHDCPISTTKIFIPSQHCVFCKNAKTRGSKKMYKTRFSLAWHISHFHKDEPNFLIEYERVRGLGNDISQEMKVHNNLQ